MKKIINKIIIGILIFFSFGFVNNSFADTVVSDDASDVVDIFTNKDNVYILKNNGKLYKNGVSNVYSSISRHGSFSELRKIENDYFIVYAFSNYNNLSFSYFKKSDSSVRFLNTVGYSSNPNTINPYPRFGIYKGDIFYILGYNDPGYPLSRNKYLLSFDGKSVYHKTFDTSQLNIFSSNNVKCGKVDIKNGYFCYYKGDTNNIKYDFYSTDENGVQSFFTQDFTGFNGFYLDVSNFSFNVIFNHLGSVFSIYNGQNFFTVSTDYKNGFLEPLQKYYFGESDTKYFATDNQTSIGPINNLLIGVQSISGGYLFYRVKDNKLYSNLVENTNTDDSGTLPNNDNSNNDTGSGSNNNLDFGNINLGNPNDYISQLSNISLKNLKDFSDKLSGIDLSGSGFLSIDTNSEMKGPIITEGDNCSVFNEDNLTFLYYSNGNFGINFSLRDWKIFDNIFGGFFDFFLGLIIGPINSLLGLINTFTPFTFDNSSYCLFGKVKTITYQKMMVGTEYYGKMTFFDYLILLFYGIFVFASIFGLSILGFFKSIPSTDFVKSNNSYKSKPGLVHTPGNKNHYKYGEYKIYR